MCLLPMQCEDCSPVHLLGSSRRGLQLGSSGDLSDDSSRPVQATNSHAGEPHCRSSACGFRDAAFMLRSKVSLQTSIISVGCPGTAMKWVVGPFFWAFFWHWSEGCISSTAIQEQRDTHSAQLSPCLCSREVAAPVTGTNGSYKLKICKIPATLFPCIPQPGRWRRQRRMQMAARPTNSMCCPCASCTSVGRLVSRMQRRCRCKQMTLSPGATRYKTTICKTMVKILQRKQRRGPCISRFDRRKGDAAAGR